MSSQSRAEYCIEGENNCRYVPLETRWVLRLVGKLVIPLEMVWETLSETELEPRLEIELLEQRVALWQVALLDLECPALLDLACPFSERRQGSNDRVSYDTWSRVALYQYANFLPLFSICLS